MPFFNRYHKQKSKNPVLAVSHNEAANLQWFFRRQKVS
jgi:hypothetical protein